MCKSYNQNVIQSYKQVKVVANPKQMQGIIIFINKKRTHAGPDMPRVAALIIFAAIL